MSFAGNELLFSNAAPSAAFDPEVVVMGRVTDFGKNHRRAFDGKTRKQGDPLYWQADQTQGTKETDRPVVDPVLTVQTPFRNWEAVTEEKRQGQDDGRRRMFLTGRSKKSAYFEECPKEAVRIAILAAGTREVKEGDFVLLKCVGVGKPSSRGINGAKRFEAQYWTAANPPEWAASCDAGLDVDDMTSDDEDDLFDE